MTSTVTLRFWAGARAAAGTAEEVWEAASVEAALEQARQSRADPGFDKVLAASAILIDGQIARPEALERRRDEPVAAEILPPFAGG
jgi:molybdopterin synthase sulfur carrier subunit